MTSIICCISNQEQFQDFCLPAIKTTSEELERQGLQPLEIITITDATSIFEGYNRGAKLASFNLKVFLHQDVNLLASSWIFKLTDAFANKPEYGLIGLVGTQKLLNDGFWWASGHNYIVGEVFSGEERVNWSFRKIDKITPVECIDGFFMATNRNIMFDESLKGFHLYDMDYCRTMAQLGYKIGVIPHKAWHIGAIREQNTNQYFDDYNKKWGLI